MHACTAPYFFYKNGGWILWYQVSRQPTAHLTSLPTLTAVPAADACALLLREETVGGGAGAEEAVCFLVQMRIPMVYGRERGGQEGGETREARQLVTRLLLLRLVQGRAGVGRRRRLLVEHGARVAVRRPVVGESSKQLLFFAWLLSRLKDWPWLWSVRAFSFLAMPRLPSSTEHILLLFFHGLDSGYV